MVSPGIMSPVQQITTHFEKWSKIVRIVAKLKNFIRFLKTKIKQEITASDLREAELLVIRDDQKLHFGIELDQLEKGHKISKNSRIKNLDPIIKNGVICHNSRLQLSSQSPFVSRTPIILDKGSSVSEKIIISYHLLNLHAGTETVLSILRKKYWLIGSRRYVRKVLHKCKAPLCRPVANMQLKMAPLPESRSTFPPVAFLNTSLDFFGPMMTKCDCGLETCVHPNNKNYGLIIVCFQTRCIHLELTSDLTSEVFLLAFRRFVGRRGCPQTLFSDNALTYKSASAELKCVVRKLNFTVIQNKLKNQYQIQWTWAKAKAPNTNGLTERLIGNVKVALRKAIFNKTFTYEELYTTLCEVEALVNNRPLGICQDSNLPITPAELCTGRPLHSLSDPIRGLPPNSLSFPYMWKARKEALNSFWKNWKNNYLLSLSPLKKWGSNDERKISVGDIIILRESPSERNTWQLGRVTKTNENEKGIITSVNLQMTGRKKEITRSIRQIALIESDMSIKGSPTEKSNHQCTEYEPVCV